MQDKITNLKVIGCILQKPALLIDDNFPLTPDDFEERFHKIIFSAIKNMVLNGSIERLDIVDIDSYLSQYDKQYKIFNDNNGFDYLQNAVDMADLANFQYHWKRIRKFSLLNHMRNNGFDVSHIYNEHIVDINEREKMQTEFDAMTIDDIIEVNEIKLLEAKNAYSMEETIQCQAGEGMRKLKEDLKIEPEFGAAGQSGILNTIYRGLRRGKLYLRSAPSGAGKTRLSVADACGVGIPELWNDKTGKWDYTGADEAVLFITTELPPDEIQTQMMAFISGVEEWKILDGKYGIGEEERVDKAIDLYEKAKIWIVQLPNFDIAEVERIAKEYKIVHKIGYLFFDYIFTSVKMLTEIANKTKGMKLREDSVLYIFAERLKTLAGKLNIHIYTATQVTGEWKNVKDGDMNILRGAKSLADLLIVINRIKLQCV